MNKPLEHNKFSINTWHFIVDDILIGTLSLNSQAWWNWVQIVNLKASGTLITPENSAPDDIPYP